jgi:hypothetical protein
MASMQIPQIPVLPQLLIPPMINPVTGDQVSLISPFSTQWQPHPGMQTELLKRLEFEIGVFGGKYGGKSAGSIMWMSNGNPHLPQYRWVPELNSNLVDPWNISYFYHPGFRGLILRRNQDDLDDYIMKAKQRWKVMGVQFLAGQFRLPMGGVIDVGHLSTASSWQKYIGVEFVRIVIEEAALIPEEGLYEQLMTCCRSIYPELRAQLLLTSNAGGPGTPWLIDRFMEAKDEDGNIIPPNQTIYFPVVDPFTGEHKTVTRIFVHSTIRDNPLAMRDPQYILVLASMKDEKMRRAYVEGDWRAFQGTYFDLARLRGPIGNEPARANHVIPAGSMEIKPWWLHVVGVDWGRTHEAAAEFAAMHPVTKQVHLFSELVVSQTSPTQFGWEIADRLHRYVFSRLPDSMMQDPPTITVALSPDAWDNRTGEKTIAQMIESGMKRRLGEGSVYNAQDRINDLKSLIETGQYEIGSGAAARERMDSMFEEIRRARVGKIRLIMAENARVTGWTVCIESLRWESVGAPSMPGFDPEIASQILREHGLESYLKYQSLFLVQDERDGGMRLDQGGILLPQLQIWGPAIPHPETGALILHPKGIGGCPRLIEAIPKAIHSELNPEDVSKKHFRGMDSLDAWRYLMMAIREVGTWEPKEVWMERKMAELRHMNPKATTRDMIHYNMEIEGEWKDREVDSLNVLNGGMKRILNKNRLTAARVKEMIG